MKKVSIDELIAGLSQFSPEDFTQDHVLAYLREYRVDEASLEPYIRFGERTFTRNPVSKDEHFEAVLLCWEPGQHSPVHRHLGQLGWMTVVRGQLVITTFTKLRSRFMESEEPDVNWSPINSIFLKQQHRYAVPEGEVIVEVTKPETIHMTENPTALKQQAISLHICSPPSAVSVIYDVENHRCRTVRMGYV